MKFARYLLIICSLVGAVAAALTARHTGKSFNVDSAVVTFFVVLSAFLTVNGIYLLASPAPGKPSDWRPVRLLRLWLDGKEADLRKRAGHSGELIK